MEMKSYNPKYPETLREQIGKLHHAIYKFWMSIFESLVEAVEKKWGWTTECDRHEQHLLALGATERQAAWIAWNLDDYQVMRTEIRIKWGMSVDESVAEELGLELGD